MKLYAPSYYKKFKCIADKCEHSCCVGWEIDIDQDTYEKYKSLENEYADTIRESLSCEETPHFKLGVGEKCPHLDECGLCKIILNVGEDYLCDICREHPRFYNFTDVCEVGIGMSCNEAARIILTSTDYDVIEEISDIFGDEEQYSFDSRTKRTEIFSILKNTSLDYSARLDKIYKKYEISLAEDSRFLSILNSMEYLNEEHKALFMNYSSSKRPANMNEYLERFLAYFVYRHTTEAIDTEDFTARLSFCLFCERLFASLICHTKADNLKKLSAIAVIISEEIEYSEENTESLTY